MSGEPRRVPLGPETDLRQIIEEIQRDRTPLVIEQNGRPVAVIVIPEDYVAPSILKSKRFKEELLSFAGAWQDVDADRLIEAILTARDEAPSSSPVEP
jgi:hypothetical protein